MTGFEIENVWGKVAGELQQHILEFWQKNNLLPPAVDATERSKQVVLTIRYKGKIVGVTSADLIQFKQLNDNLFYMFRMAVLPQFRLPGIESKLIVESQNILEEFAKTQSTNKAIGVLVFVENPSLREKRNEAVWPASKMVYVGSDKQGRHIRVCYFKGARV